MRKLLICLLKGLNFVVRKVSAFTHFAQFAVQWGFHPRPEWFDHFLDQHWQFSAKNNGLWVERGVFSRMVLKPNARMLEICCGDGFNARHFYSSRAASIVALDFNKDAIPHAKRYNSVPNITYVQKDVREGLPTGPFDNIVWDAATPRACPCLRTGKRAVQFFNIDSAILNWFESVRLLKEASSNLFRVGERAVGSQFQS